MFEPFEKQIPGKDGSNFQNVLTKIKSDAEAPALILFGVQKLCLVTYQNDGLET